MHASKVQGGEPAAWGVAVERGPDWLFLRIESPSESGAARRGDGGGNRLTDRIVGMIRENHARRVVLELDGVAAIDEEIIGTIADVGSQVRDDGGLIRVCGLSQPNLSKLRSSGRADGLPHFDSRSAAVAARGGSTR